MLTNPYYDRMIYHLVNELAKFIPWIIREGEPDFPASSPWQLRSGLGALNFVKLTCDADNSPLSVEAKDSLSKVVKIDFTIDKPNQKITMDYKYDGVIEGTMTEEILANGDQKLTMKVSGVTTNDLTVLVKAPTDARPPHGGFTVEIDLGSASYDGVIVPYSNTVPTFINSFISDLNTKTPVTVTAMARDLLLPFGNWISAFDFGDKGESEPPPASIYAILNVLLVIADNLYSRGRNSPQAAIGCLALIAVTRNGVM